MHLLVPRTNVLHPAWLHGFCADIGKVQIKKAQTLRNELFFYLLVCLDNKKASAQWAGFCFILFVALVSDAFLMNLAEMYHYRARYASENLKYFLAKYRNHSSTYDKHA